MSLYNAIFGVNPFASVLLEIVGTTPSQVPRFRDCFLNADGTEIIIHTRTGGGNRPDYVEENEYLRSLAGFKRDEDARNDNTYANFHYAVPEALREKIVVIRDLGGTGDPEKRWHEMLEKLSRGDKEDPTVQRALEVGKNIVDQLKGLK